MKPSFKKQYNNSHSSLISMSGFSMDTPIADIHIPQELYIKEGLHNPYLTIDKSVFAKSDVERTCLKLMKKENKKLVLAAGKNPKKHMNPTSSN